MRGASSNFAHSLSEAPAGTVANRTKTHQPVRERTLGDGVPQQEKMKQRMQERRPPTWRRGPCSGQEISKGSWAQKPQFLPKAPPKSNIKKGMRHFLQAFRYSSREGTKISHFHAPQGTNVPSQATTVWTTNGRSVRPSSYLLQALSLGAVSSGQLESPPSFTPKKISLKEKFSQNQRKFTVSHIMYPLKRMVSVS